MCIFLNFHQNVKVKYTSISFEKLKCVFMASCTFSPLFQILSFQLLFSLGVSVDSARKKESQQLESSCDKNTALLHKFLLCVKLKNNFLRIYCCYIFFVVVSIIFNKSAKLVSFWSLLIFPHEYDISPSCFSLQHLLKSQIFVPRSW